MAGKTLVVLGYHSDELEWGRRVRETFESIYPDDKSVCFLEIKDSPVRTGFPSAEVDQTIQDVVKREGDVRLLFVIHSDFTKNKNEDGKASLMCTFSDPRVVEQVNEIYPSGGYFPTAKKNTGAPLDFHLTKNVVQGGALSETYLTSSSYEKRDETCRKAENRVAGMIHTLHRLHVSERLSPESIISEKKPDRRIKL
jgi:hypothetical protein